MEQLLNALVFLVIFATGYWFGIDSGFKKAMELLAEGKLHLSLWVKSEQVSTKLFEVNTPKKPETE